jgi:hypothetical protein
VRVVISLRATIDPGDGEAEPAPQELHEALWAYVQDAWDMWSVFDDEGISDYVCDLDSDRPEGWGPRGDQLSYVFPDLDGRCPRSCEAIAHWFLLVLESDWEEISRIFAEHGLTLGGEPPCRVRPARFVRLRGELWCLGEGHRLFSDRERLDTRELSASEQAQVARAREACECRPCRLGRPADDLAADLARILRDEPGLAVVSGIAWYLARMSDPGHALLAAVARCIERSPDTCAPLLEAVERLGARRALEAGGLPVVARLLLRKGRDESDLDDLVEGLGRPAPTCGVAAELASGHRDEHRTLGPLVVHALGELAGEHEWTRHHLVNALVNLYLDAGGIPARVLRQLEAEAARSSEAPHTAASLARWALRLFARWPTIAE